MIAPSAATMALIAVTIGLILLETARPARARRIPRRRRWAINVALWGAGGLLIALSTRFAPALSAEAFSGIGLLAQFDGPVWFEAAIALLALDLAVYALHRALHSSGALWRLHSAHHSDPELDVSTALRFHPFELGASLLWKSAAAAAIGAPAALVIAYEAALSAGSLFNHANIALPRPMERALSWLIVTPSAHRRHHDRAQERNPGHYGTLLSLWDRLFGTWRNGPEPNALGLSATPGDGVSMAATLGAPFSAAAGAFSAPPKTPTGACPPG